MLTDVQIPLVNINYAISQFLQSKGQKLDPETRALLVGVRASVGRVACATRELAIEDNTTETETKGAAEVPLVGLRVI